MKNNIFILNKINGEIINQLVNIYFSAFSKFYFRNWSFQDFIDLINNGYSIFYSIYNDKVIGFAVVSFNKDFSEIITIAVESNYQRKNVGRNLLNYIMSSADFEGNFILDVAIINTVAIKFYEKVGFKEIGKRHNYYLICEGDNVGQKIDAAVMQLRLY
ncbi:MAG: GNAT family N-acetyltransferase [Pelagibacterales bacterium]|nr:GNAT family N-acetyltransferase [Pelagibacterales bacterium]